MPAILLVAETSFRAPTGRLLLAALRTVAEEAGVAMCVQLDRVSDDALIDAALAAGVGAVMVDGSKLPTERNCGVCHGRSGDGRARSASRSSSDTSRAGSMLPPQPRPERSPIPTRQFRSSPLAV